MRLNRIHTSKDSRKKLSTLKSRTGLSPNILCRIGLMLSLAEPNQPEVDRDTTDGSELHRDTLMGECDPLVVALLEEWCVTNGIDTNNDTLVKYFRAHLNRGVRLLYGRVKGLEDLANLLS